MPERFLGVPVDAVDEGAVLAAAQRAVKTGSRLLIVAINPEKVMRAERDPELREFIARADLRIADGVGLVLASRLRGGAITSRVTGIDLMQRLCALATSEGLRVFLLGARPEVVRDAAEELGRRFPGIIIAGTHDGYFASEDAQRVAEAVRASGAQMLFVAMGSPSQERFLRDYGERTGASVLMGVGGSLDVLAGRVPRAPGSMRRLGLEWLYRLYREPWRFRRMLVLPVFLLRSLRADGRKDPTP